MRFGTGFILGILSVFVLAGALIAWGGLGFKATEGHSPPVKAVLDFAISRSVHHHAAAIDASGFEQASAERGMQILADRCARCHGAPGERPQPFAQHMRPQPLDLAQHAEHMSPSEIYYISRYGIIMTGMPGFDGILSEQELWDVTAAVKSLPSRTGDAGSGRQHARQGRARQGATHQH